MFWCFFANWCFLLITDRLEDFWTFLWTETQCFPQSLGLINLSRKLNASTRERRVDCSSWTPRFVARLHVHRIDTAPTIDNLLTGRDWHAWIEMKNGNLFLNSAYLLRFCFPNSTHLVTVCRRYRPIAYRYSCAIYKNRIGSYKFQYCMLEKASSDVTRESRTSILSGVSVSFLRPCCILLPAGA